MCFLRKERVVLVTGGTTGIGKAIAIALKNLKYQVVANYIVLDSKDEADLKAADIRLKHFDVSNFEATQMASQEIKEELGSIDILINNAGIIRDAFLHKMGPEKWEAVMAVNTSSVFNCCQAVIQDMRNQKFGRIVSISSVNGLKGQMGQSNYSASKAAVIGFTKALAQESANKNITVNCVAPGYVNTSMTASIDADVLKNQILPQIPMGRLAEVDEIVDAVIFLIEKGSYITGQTLSVNGGQYM